ncbi:MAG: type II secretion system protein GspL [Gammaproteobacteria bacterium]
MPDTLVVRLSAEDPERGSWIAVDPQGRRVGPPGAGALADAAPHVSGRRLAVLVPAVDVLLTRVSLPVRGASRILKALPFALEEQLAEDVEDLHFAAAPLPDGRVSAAAVNREQLTGWMDVLREAGLQPQVMCSEAEGVPDVPNHLSWILESNRCLARSAGDLPVVLDVDSVAEALRFGPGFPDGGENGRHLSVYLTQDAQDRFGEALENLRPEVSSLEVRLLPDGILPHLAATVATGAPVNLLQGEFAPRTNVDKLWKPWRLPAALAAGLVLVGIGVQAVELSRLKAEEARLDEAVAAAFEKAMPGARMVDARAQIDRRLALARGAGAETNESFLAALDALGGALAATPGVTLEAISFRSGTLDLRLEAPSVDALEAIRQNVARSGRFTASFQQANPRDTGVEGRIQVSGSGA